MIEHELECPECHHKFIINEDYESGDCPKCGKAHFYWDHVLTEEYEEIFSGYYWSIDED
jgi:Zn finger protein HypA/HybF involved in hydrogenase expression